MFAEVALVITFLEVALVITFLIICLHRQTISRFPSNAMITTKSL